MLLFGQSENNYKLVTVKVLSIMKNRGTFINKLLQKCDLEACTKKDQ